MPTALREIPRDRAPDEAVVREIVAALAGGSLVALPTETVYGLAARADLEEALERLRSGKGSDADRAFTWHVADAATALETVGALPALTKRIADRYWPGPLTLVLQGVPKGLEAVALDGWTGVRVPAHEGTRAILAAADFPVVMTSANRAGERPLADAGSVLEAFEGSVPLVVDGGPARLAESSTVLALGRGRFEVLREGLISADDLRNAGGLSILFVCTGNTCRSPMAEALASTLLAEALGTPDPAEFGFRIASAGVFAGVGAPASAHTVDVLAEESIELGDHRSRTASPELVAAADRVYCLTADHRDALVASLAPGKARHVELVDPFGRDVPDPMGGDLDRYRACFAVIRAALEARLAEWV